MIPADVDYVRAQSLDAALAALVESEALVLAGGHSLVPMMKLRLARPSRVVDISRLDLGGLRNAGGELEIGALATWREIDESPLVRARFAAVAECAAGVGDLQVRNWGTIGGGTAHADPAADMPAALLAFDATIRLASADGERRVAARDFFLGPFTTARGDQEILVALTLPEPPPDEGSAYSAIKDPASGYPLAGAAARIRLDGERVASASVALTGLAGRPFRAAEVEEGLVGSSPAAVADMVRDALEGVPIADEPRIDAAYRRQLGRVVIRRAVESAAERARGGGA